ncbi:MAG: discoidin domain-containing protein [Armatimonadetes bacterium]|nr:discoidin domain-containing protein [Armatimonadota bacterium]
MLAGISSLASLLLAQISAPGVLTEQPLRQHVARFNAQDSELYTNAVPNAQAADFLAANVPLFECPDPEIERTWYFRWWTYRKHLRQTPDGYVVTEFLPPVPWASKHNTISCAAGHHLYEGRWLRDPRYLDDYTRFLLRGSDGLHRYSHWLGDAIWARRCADGNGALPQELLPDLTRNYRAWEKERRDGNGLFWQVDGADGMEVAIGGTGYRATINSYMYADARAIAAIATAAGQADVARQFGDEAARIRQLVQDKLWDAEAQFFKMRPRPAKPGDPEPPLADVRELYGYTPWYFDLPDAKYSVAWRQLMDPQGFHAPFGPTAAEQRDPRFSVLYRGHECQWNGPSWPYSTSVTLVALANLLNDYQQEVVTKADYWDTLRCYTRSHALREQRLEVVGAAARKPPLGPRSSADAEELRHTWWSPETLGTTQWVQYTFDQPQSADAAEVYWYVDGQGCALPERWRVQYLDGETWREVAGATYGREIDRYNRADFGPRAAKAFRIEATAIGGKSAGILEWRLLNGPDNVAGRATPTASCVDKYQGRIAGLNSTATARTPVLTPGEVPPADAALLDTLGRQPWIDENLNPYTGDWIARSLLVERGQQPRDRGKDYNHSTYCDLIITGLIGLRPQPDDSVVVNPLVPDGQWDYFCLDRVPYHGRLLTILWDKTGQRYGRGAGLRVLADGQEIAVSPDLKRVSTKLPAGAAPAAAAVPPLAPPTPAPPVPAWVKSPGNPVLGGALGTCFDISVLRDGERYRMWFSWRPRKSIALVESKDGVHWSEPVIVLGPNPASGWEEDMNRPVVIRRADGYHMWFTGQAKGGSRIGYATSADGVTWRRATDKPVLAPEAAWEKVAVMCPHVLWDEATRQFRMWYSGGDQYEPDAIGYATSPDGIAWTRLPANPIFAADPKRVWEQHKVTACQVVRQGDWHIMFYIGFEDEHLARIGIARSRDGITGWQRLATNPIIGPTPDTWDASACYKPVAILDGTRWLLWYNGRRESVEQIGLAVHEGADLGFGD